MGPGRWDRTVAAESNSEKAMTTRTAPATSLAMRAPEGVRREDTGLSVVRYPSSVIRHPSSLSHPDERTTNDGLLEEVRPAASRLPVPRPLRLPSHPRVPQLLAARDALLGHEALEHELARRHHRAGILLGREADLVDEVEQPRDHAEALQAGLRALVHRDLEGAALVEPVDAVVDVGAADARLEGLAGGAPDQILRDDLGTLELTLVFELELAGDGGQRRVDVGDARHDRLLLGED